jgi:hypothetical protein
MKTKTILDVTKDEIMIKFDKFIQDLGIPGSLIGYYDLYSALYTEYEKGQAKILQENN